MADVVGPCSGDFVMWSLRCPGLVRYESRRGREGEGEREREREREREIYGEREREGERERVQYYIK